MSRVIPPKGKKKKPKPPPLRAFLFFLFFCFSSATESMCGVTRLVSVLYTLPSNRINYFMYTTLYTRLAPSLDGVATPVLLPAARLFLIGMTTNPCMNDASLLMPKGKERKNRPSLSSLSCFFIFFFWGGGVPPTYSSKLLLVRRNIITVT